MRSLIVAASVLIAPVWIHAQTPCTIQQGAAYGDQVWLLCQSRQVFVSPDRGAKWESRTLPGDAQFRALALLDGRRALVAGDRGTLLATDDGGRSWRTVALPTTNDLNAIHFVGELGWLAGASGTILHSSDGGRTWVQQTSGVPLGIDGIYFADATHGWAVGWVGMILRTTDGGRTWERVKATGTSWSLSSVYFRDRNTGWAVGFNGQILRSLDGGRSWELQPSPTQAWLTWVTFDQAGRGWIAARNQLLTSEDGGASWRPVPAGNTMFLQQVLPVGGAVWAVGNFNVLTRSPAAQEFAALDINAGPGQSEPSAGG